jgi:hypothetical protein
MMRTQKCQFLTLDKWEVINLDLMKKCKKNNKWRKIDNVK